VPSPTPTPTPAPSLIAEQQIEDAGAPRLTIGGFTDWIVATEGDAWAAVGSDVRRLAGGDGAEIASIAVPGAMCVAMDVGFGSIWVGSCEAGSPSIVRLDAQTTTIAATIPLPFEDIQFEGSVGAGEGAVWAVSREPDHVLVKVDPASDSVVGTFPMPDGLAGVRAGYGAVWIAQPAEDAVLQVDPADGTVLRAIPVGPGPRFLAVGEGSVWSLNQVNGSVSRIDPATGAVLATIPTSLRDVDGGDIAVGCGLVWARITDALVATIDPATNQVPARYGPASGGGSVACADGAAWVSAEVVGAIWRLPVE
jgi:YVTN family beta-propeller protein